MKKILRHVIEFGMFILLSILNVTPLITFILSSNFEKKISAKILLFYSKSSIIVFVSTSQRDKCPLQPRRLDFQLHSSSVFYKQCHNASQSIAEDLSLATKNESYWPLEVKIIESGFGI